MTLIKEKNKGYNLKHIIAILLIVLTIPLMFGCGSSSISSESTEEVETPEPTPIDDFSYTTSEETISLIHYEGNEEIIEIMPSYEVDGTSFTTDLSDFQVSENDVKTVIFDSGITSINISTFNGCDITTVYFPKTIGVMYDYTLSYLDKEDEKIQIYYEGTEEEWNAIFTDYETVKDSGAEDLAEAAGQAGADFINGLFGSSEYDPSLFEFHYSASVDDVR